jgi:ABC-type nitrate/sulfonate/bicarbonate transport system ATPase subunit
MRQRVAIAQAIITQPRVLLLDEPFGALDEATREALQTMLLEFYDENVAALKEDKEPPYTIFIVTHELNEAIYVSDRVVGLSQYWDWEAAGFEACPGATIIYDRAAPIYRPDDPKEHEDFLEQRGEIRRIVFDEEHLPDADTHVAFWNNVRTEGGRGVLRKKA